jgi:hypothetical protein
MGEIGRLRVGESSSRPGGVANGQVSADWQGNGGPVAEQRVEDNHRYLTEVGVDWFIDLVVCVLEIVHDERCSGEWW